MTVEPEQHRFELGEAENHFRQLVAGIQDYAIFILSLDGIVLTWNAGAERIKGYAADEIIGRSFTTFYTPDALASGWPQHELKVARAVGRFEDEGWRVRQDGTQFWANVVISAIPDEQGRPKAFLKITRDLTDRKRAEETLRQSEERVRLIIESVQDYAIFQLDPDGRVMSWNSGAERIKGYTASEIIGQHFSRFYPSEDLAADKPARALELALRDGRVEDEGWRVRKDGSLFWANVVITALYDPQGELRGFAKITRDMTQRRQVEALEHADRQKNEFLAMLAHELRNPLAPIRTGIDLLKSPDLDAADAAATTAMMDRQVNQLVRLVDDLLDVSRIVSGKITLRKSPMPLGHIVDRAVEEIRSYVDERGHELRLTVPDEPIWVDADEVRLTQVLSNLLENAAKYSKTPAPIWLSIAREGDLAVIRVRDEGIGIDPQLLSDIFKLFVQVDATLARSEGGMGLGLTLVKRLVELHGGSVDAASEGPGRGSQFTIRLPLAEPAQATPGSANGAPKQAAKRRVLVVDDNVDAAVAVSTLLKVWGHDVQTVYDGPSAVETARMFRPEIVLLDIGLPGMSGYEVAAQLRSEPIHRGVFITALSGYGQAEDRERSREAGFDYHITKPPDAAALQAMVAAPHDFMA